MVILGRELLQALASQGYIHLDQCIDDMPTRSEVTGINDDLSLWGKGQYIVWIHEIDACIRCWVSALSRMNVKSNIRRWFP